MPESAQISRKLPPSERDFDIYEAVHIAGYPTRDEAQKYAISQTRVRQIVRRVVEWLGEVIPPQAKIAKEQQSHLARQIAADRFNLQYAEASTNWYQSGDLKFAGLRIRLTHAQARLGVPGSLIGGLAADAIEGLEVPAYEPPAEPNPKSKIENPKCSDLDHDLVGRGSQHAPSPTADLRAQTDDDSASLDPDLFKPEYFDINSDIYRRPLNRRNLKNLPPELYDPIALADITAEIVAARAYYGFPLKAAIVRELQEEGQLPTSEDIRQGRLSPGKESSDSHVGCVESATADETHQSAIGSLQSEICNLQSPSSPPPGDFSAPNKPSNDGEGAPEAPPAENTASTPTCDEPTTASNTAPQDPTAPSQPLLTIDSELPVTELNLTAHHPGATLSPTTSASPPLAPLSPCPPVRPAP